jgi:glyoxylase-like metal-dependent hydrolase (beta-lactamase superfamily II)
MMHNPLGAFLDSLRVVRARPDARLLPAHGPVTESAHARVDELLAHHGNRLDQTLAGVRSGAHTAYDVATTLRWTRREHSVSDLDPFNAMLAVFETAAHLDLLVAQGRVTQAFEGGVAVYA